MTTNYENFKEFMYKHGYTNRLILSQLIPVCKSDTENIYEYIKYNDLKKDKFSEALSVHFLNTISISTEYTINLSITDNNNDEISDDTEIIIIKHKTSETMIRLTKRFYSEIKNGYNFKKDVVIPHGYHIDIIVKSKIDIPKENINFVMTFDYWTKEVC